MVGGEAMTRSNPRRRGAFEPLDCSKALHEFERFPLKYMGEHAEQIREYLNVTLEKTYFVAPLRKPRTGAECDLYRLKRKPTREPSGGERKLEYRIWRRWGPKGDSSDKPDFLPGCCRYLLTFQMPLQNSRRDTSWGKVDLVGVSPEGLPVVMELKVAKAQDTPLRMLIEAVAYAVAVRKAWNEGCHCLARAWSQNMGIKLSVLRQVPLVCLAPKLYWDRCLGKSGRRGAVPRNAWKPFKMLMKELDQRGFPVSLAQFDEGQVGEDGLPDIGPPEIIYPDSLPA
jgi:hypothetical protein